MAAGGGHQLLDQTRGGVCAIIGGDGVIVPEIGAVVRDGFELVVDRHSIEEDADDVARHATERSACGQRMEWNLKRNPR